MKVEKIDHIGIAVESIDDWIGFYRDILGLDYTGSEEVAEQKVRVAFLTIGESRIELLEPTSPDSPIAGFLEKRGGGMHHIALKVDDIEEALIRHKKSGARLIDETPRIGAHGTRIAFIHPKASGGVLLELCQKL
ncbi:MAG: methylmalonyl-CoA epimerase [Candidatus Thorarchaeota archaeon]|nr:methylmalonyl-CoA epimerase [Candidatus Thorarchaeota archaeon]